MKKEKARVSKRELELMNMWDKERASKRERECVCASERQRK